MFTRSISNGYQLEDIPHGLGYRLGVETGPEQNWSLKISGWLPNEYVSTVESQSWIHINGSEFITADKYISYLKERYNLDQNRLEFYYQVLETKNHNDYWIEATVIGPGTDAIRFYLKYFERGFS
ncbi:MAG: hypothetical protein ABIG63_16985 [Chloroflexota bacterium]